MREPFVLISLAMTIGLHEIWQLERAREGGSCTTNPVNEYFHQIESDNHLQTLTEWFEIINSSMDINSAYIQNWCSKLW